MLWDLNFYGGDGGLGSPDSITPEEYQRAEEQLLQSVFGIVRPAAAAAAAAARGRGGSEREGEEDSDGDGEDEDEEGEGEEEGKGDDSMAGAKVRHRAAATRVGAGLVDAPMGNARAGAPLPASCQHACPGVAVAGGTGIQVMGLHLPLSRVAHCRASAAPLVPLPPSVLPCALLPCPSRKPHPPTSRRTHTPSRSCTVQGIDLPLMDLKGR